MAGHFLVLIVGEACSHLLRDMTQCPLKAIERSVHPAVLYFYKDRKSNFAHHQGLDCAGVAYALDQIALPLTKELAVLN